MRNRIFESPWWGIGAAVLSILLASFVIRVNRSVDITVATSSMNDAAILNISEHLRDLRTNAAFFNFKAQVKGPAQPRLRIQSVNNPTFFDKGEVELDSEGKFTKPVQLGSDRWPLTQDEDYTFEVVDLYTNRTLLEGKILARVSEHPAAPPALAALIGVAASILALLQPIGALFASSSTGPSDRNRREPILEAY